MMGLWTDGWFYISSAGLLVSGILFFFLLGQYRAASEAADVTDGELGVDKEISAPAGIRPVYFAEELPAAQIASHPPSEPESKPKPEGEYSERRKDPAITTSGISPAVVYLQNIKGELAELHQEMRALAKRVDDELSSVSARDEALIDRLGELTRAVENMKVEAAASATETAAPKKTRKVEKAPEAERVPPPEPAPVVLAPASAPEPEPVVVLPSVAEPKTEPARPDETIRMELGAIIGAQTTQPEPTAPAAEPAEPTPAPSEPAPDAPAPEAPAPEEKPRRGPVWPV